MRATGACLILVRMRIIVQMAALILFSASAPAGVVPFQHDGIPSHWRPQRRFSLNSSECQLRLSLIEKILFPAAPAFFAASRYRLPSAVRNYGAITLIIPHCRTTAASLPADNVPSCTGNSGEQVVFYHEIESDADDGCGFRRHDPRHKKISMTLFNAVDRKIILASASPRRREILRNLGFSFDVRRPAPGLEDSALPIDTLRESIARLALTKARSVAAHCAGSLVLGGDTAVVVDDQVLGKPAGRDDAARMIRLLAGRTHQVYTGIALVCEDEQFARTDCAGTRVTFRSLDDQEIEAYLAERDYADKAGAYAIQGRAMSFVDSIQGCFYNVVGLPVTKTIELFQAYISRKERDDVRCQ
jgi:septum formation protein